ncbi:hypothetical protein CCHR01_06400 [Colletotrichum chrysophilum]|uniref:Uncharacterized protein n=1 Tax=Colletotrichum chrysophilum TaxID=1836956 RepID=A0AAD9ENH6_9PEZI|nr:hypothetical protein CCHR01_06400 [Colletotrichum chrysophilum]
MEMEHLAPPPSPPGDWNREARHGRDGRTPAGKNTGTPLTSISLAEVPCACLSTCAAPHFGLSTPLFHVHLRGSHQPPTSFIVGSSAIDCGGGGAQNLESGDKGRSGVTPTPNTQLAQAGEGPRQRYGAAATGLGLLSTGYPGTSAQIADTLHRRVPFRSTMHLSLFPIVRLAAPCLTSPRLCCSLRLSNDLRENYVTSGVLAQWESGDALSSPASYPAPAVSQQSGKRLKADLPLTPTPCPLAVGCESVALRDTKGPVGGRSPGVLSADWPFSPTFFVGEPPN